MIPGYGQDAFIRRTAPSNYLLADILPLPSVPTPQQLLSPAQSADYFYDLGNAYYRDNRFVEAVQAFTQTLALDAGNYLAAHKRAKARTNLKDYMGALQDYTYVLMLKPDYANAWNNRANIKVSIGDYQGAIADYTEAIRVAPMDPVAYENRAELYTKLKMIPQAVEDKGTAIRLHKLKAPTLPPQGPTFVPKRFALVIGNGDYDGVDNDLGNGPINDAIAMRNALQAGGFQVTSGMNLTAAQMRLKIAEFTNLLKQNPGSVALIYYSGHGGSINGNNYLLATDHGLGSGPYNPQNPSVSINYILRELKQMPTYFNMLIFDACRTPLATSNLFSAGAPAVKHWETEAGPGLTNVWIEYASRPMTPALQDGNNGLYTKYLLQYLLRPDLNLQEVAMYTSYALAQDPVAQQQDQHASTQTDLSRTGPIANAFSFANPSAPLPLKITPSV